MCLRYRNGSWHTLPTLYFHHSTDSLTGNENIIKCWALIINPYLGSLLNKAPVSEHLIKPKRQRKERSVKGDSWCEDKGDMLLSRRAGEKNVGEGWVREELMMTRRAERPKEERVWKNRMCNKERELWAVLNCMLDRDVGMY